MCSDDKVELLPVDKRPLVSEEEFALRRFRQGWRCKECSDGEVKMTLFNQNRSWFCSASEYLEDASFKANTLYDPLCRNYKASQETLKCEVCLPNAVLNLESVCIERNQGLNNC